MECVCFDRTFLWSKFEVKYYAVRLCLLIYVFFNSYCYDLAVDKLCASLDGLIRVEKKMKL